MNTVYYVAYYGKRKNRLGTESGCAGIFSTMELAEEYVEGFNLSNSDFVKVEFSIKHFKLDVGGI